MNSITVDKKMNDEITHVVNLLNEVLVENEVNLLIGVAALLKLLENARERTGLDFSIMKLDEVTN